METLTAELESAPLAASKIVEEVTVLEAMTGYVREVNEAVERAVKTRWVEAFAGIPGEVARRAFRAWDRGDRMPNPVELAKRARALEAEMREAARCKAAPARREVTSQTRGERVTAEAAARILEEAGFDPKARRGVGRNVVGDAVRRIAGEEGD